MKIKVKSKYLVFPVNKEGAVKRLKFVKDGEEVYGLNIRLDNILPDFYAYIDVERFVGEEMEIAVDPEMPICFREADEMRFEDEYREPLRPQVHFTTKNGWNNDPNGLVYVNGTYHLFYQYNPCAPQWNNMHWGHAVSKDLLHWEEKDIALFPEAGGTMYSGSAIEDKENLLALNTDEQNAILLYYTLTAEPRPQCLAYSTDGGNRFVKYEGNPVLPHVEAYNRDPKVVWCEELGRYLMALYLNDDRYGFYTSENLVDWKPLQQITLSGDSECPDIFSLTDDEGKRFWVLMGASDKYLIGVFEDGRFVPVQSQHSLHYGKINYAAQSFNGIPDGRVVRIAWNKLKVDGGRFSQQMGFPTEMSVEKLSGEYYLRSRPVAEIDELIESTDIQKNIDLSETALKAEVAAAPLLIRIRAERNARFAFNVFGGKITVDPSFNELGVLGSKAPLSITEADTEFTILIDRCSMEVFADGGKICLTERFVCDYNLPYITLTGKGKIKNLEVHTLKSIWREKQ